MTLKKGMTGDAVKRLQQALKSADSYMFGNLVVDGVYGSGTENAVKIFQQMKGLSADGIAGPQTLTALGLSDIANAVATTSNTTSAPATSTGTGTSIFSSIPKSFYYGLGGIALITIAAVMIKKKKAGMTAKAA